MNPRSPEGVEALSASASTARGTARIGLIEVGLLGAALAECLIADNWRVVGFDTDQARLELLRNLGGEPGKAWSGQALVMVGPGSSLRLPPAGGSRGGVRASLPGDSDYSQPCTHETSMKTRMRTSDK